MSCSPKSVYSKSQQYVCNPLTKRWIRRGGPTHQRLQRKGIVFAEQTGSVRTKNHVKPSKQFAIY